MKYLAILRGINVSGQKKIKMADLKLLCESLGFKNIVTYIQSGNIIFDTNQKRKIDLANIIESAIEKEYQFQVPVIIRTSAEMTNIVKNCPFNDIDLVGNGTKVLVTFLSEKPLDKNVKDLNQFVVAPEIMHINSKEVYLYCPNGYGKTKLSNTFIEKKLKLKATTRNWKSVSKLHELSIECSS